MFVIITGSVIIGVRLPTMRLPVYGVALVVLLAERVLLYLVQTKLLFVGAAGQYFRVELARFQERIEYHNPLTAW